MKIFLLTFLLPFLPNNTEILQTLSYKVEWKNSIKTKNVVSFYSLSYYRWPQKDRTIIQQKLVETFPHQTIFQCKHGYFVVFPNNLSGFVTKNNQICPQPATTFTTDAFYFLFDENKNLLKNTDEIDENTNFVILARVNYRFDLYNKNGKYFGEDYRYDDKNFWKISELNTFIGEKIEWKCEKLKCKINKKSLPSEVLKAVETDLNYRFDLKTAFEKIEITENEVIFHFASDEKIMDYFTLSEWHHY